jgi:sulfur-oxidizing protein SoxY
MTLTLSTTTAPPVRRIAAALALFALFFCGAARAQDSETEVWRKIRDSQFAGRTFEDDAQAVIALDAPNRAEDAAVVPLLIHATAPQTEQRWIRKIWLVIDKNPSPMGAVFTLTPDSGRADIETRIRIEDYSWVRAIAETSDGKLYMAMKFVKASGGCSRLGRMKFRTDDVQVDKPSQAELAISHPNVSGLAMDQITRLYATPRFVRNIQVKYAGKPIMSADVDFTISENPNFRFYFVPHGAGDLQAEVVDSNNASFETTLAVRPGVAPGS